MNGKNPAGRQVGVALEALQVIAQSKPTLTVNQAGCVATEAIRWGAVLYNADDAGACRRVYAEAIALASSKLPLEGQRDAEQSALYRLARAATDTNTRFETNEDAAAWALRGALEAFRRLNKIEVHEDVHAHAVSAIDSALNVSGSDASTALLKALRSSFAIPPQPTLYEKVERRFKNSALFVVIIVTAIVAGWVLDVAGKVKGLLAPPAASASVPPKASASPAARPAAR